MIDAPNKYRHFIIIFLLWLILWSALFLTEYSRGNINAGILLSDSLEYYTSAVNFYEHGVFSRAFHEPFTPDRFRTPLYPLVAGAVLKIFGGIAAVYVFQFILFFMSAVGIYFIADLLWRSKKVALTASLAFVFNPVAFLLVNSFMSETLFLFLLVFGAYFFLRYIKSGSYALFASSMLFFSLNALVRPAVLYFVFLAFIYSILVNFNLRKLAINTLIFFVVFSAVLFPWFLRNRIIFGDWHFTSADLVNVYYMHFGQLYAWQNKVSLHEGFAALKKLCVPSEINEDYHGLCVNQQLRKTYIPILSQIDKPVIFKYVALGGIRYLFNDGFNELGNWFCQHKCSKAPLNLIDDLAKGGKNILSIILNKPPPLLFTWIFGKIIWAVIFISVGFFLWNRKKNNMDKESLIFILLTLLYFFLISIPAWTTRYRAPFDPFLFLLAAPGFWRLKDYMSHVRHKRI